MSRSGTKGREGEQGPIIYLTEGWFPHAEKTGVAPVRGRSEGAKDRGDIYNVPYTMIEAKNYANPPVGPLLNNAEWKAQNAKMPVWFLVYKRKGFSKNRAGEWHTLMTLQGFIDAFGPTYDEQAVTVEEFAESCQKGEGFYVETTTFYPGQGDPPEHPWYFYVECHNFYNPIEAKREAIMSQVTLDPSGERTITFIVHPRVGETPDKWYVYTRLSHMCRALETVGVLNQKENQYDTFSN